MKLLFDLFPVAAFFIAYRIGKSFPEESAAFVAATFGPVAVSATFPDLVAVIVATTIAIVATLLQVGWLLARRQPVKPMLWLSAILIVAFGGMTIWLQNELFIKWKPSLLYWSFAAILIGGRVLFRRNLLSALLGSELRLPTLIWDRLLWMWAGFFGLLGAANLYVAYQYTTEQWVDFKTFGLIGLTFAFVLGLGVYLSRHVKEVSDA
ncbi:MAG TPA: septation protein A [Burkholderiaceae bacterium]|nr:septation protein A [Burkholderiaceae bacterium]